MCGLVEAALRRGHTITHLALVPVGDKLGAGIEFKPSAGLDRLSRAEVHYAPRRPHSRVNWLMTAFDRWFVSAYDRSYAERLTETSEVLSEKYDGVIAFESLAIHVVRGVESNKKFLILGDPVGQRRWHSADKSDIRSRVLAAMFTFSERRHFRNVLQRDAGVGMFGAWHVEKWTKALGRRVVELRPMFPTTSLESEKRENSTVPEFAFGGTLASTASRMAIQFLERGLLPSLRNTFRSGFRLKVIGASSSELKRFASMNPEVLLTGRVPSFEQELANTGVFIAPMRYPVGVRTRVCSALAAGCFCICDKSVLRNMPELATCKAVRIAHTAEDYSRVLAEFFEKRSNRTNLEQEARAFYLEHYDCSVAARPILNFLEDVEPNSAV